MGRTKIDLDKKILRKLYWDKGLSPYKIARMFSCSFSTVANRLKEYGIRFKNHSEARNKYSKHNFSGNRCEKYYMIGFRIGDLNVYKTSGKSKYLIARCHTTSENQVAVIKKLFSAYGQVTVSKSEKSFHVNCYLNDSFSFLIPKSLPRNILDKKSFMAFFAGYFDAEGYLGIWDRRPRIKIDSYDKDVIKFLSSRFNKYRYQSIVKMIGICKTQRNFGQELWRLNVNRAQDVSKLINDFEEYSLHHKKLKQIEKAKKCLKDKKL